MKKTAVDYLIKEVSAILGQLKTEPMQDLLLVDAINKANKMFEQQIIDARNDMQKSCIELANKINPHLFEFDKKDGEQYYTSTYGSKGSDGHELDDDIPPTSQYFPTSSQTQHNSPKLENKTSFGEVSDEQIEKEGWKYCYENKISLKNIVPWINACEWYREQLNKL